MKSLARNIFITILSGVLFACTALDTSSTVRPAIALSGWDEPEDVTRAIRAGFQRHLSKPVDPDLLLSCAATIAARSANVG